MKTNKTFNDENHIAQGYACAEAAYDKLSKPPHTSTEWVTFFRDATSSSDNLDEKAGAALFITEKEVKDIHLGTLNQQMGQLDRLSVQYRIDLRMVDHLLLSPRHRQSTGEAIEIPVPLRPDYHYSDATNHVYGKLGCIYMKEVGMRMYLPHADIYDADDADKLLCAGEQLESTSVKASELLTALQTILDPEHKDDALLQAISRCKSYEEQPFTLPQLLKAHHIGVVSFVNNSWPQINYCHIHGKALYAELDESDHLQVTLAPGRWFHADDNPFDLTITDVEFSDNVKEALNRAR